jgi:hypothetical protein
MHMTTQVLSESLRAGDSSGCLYSGQERNEHEWWELNRTSAPLCFLHWTSFPSPSWTHATKRRPTTEREREKTSNNWLEWGAGVLEWISVLARRLGESSLITWPWYRHRWEANIKMDFKECEGAEWIHLRQDRFQWRILMKTVMNVRVL